MDFRPDQPMHNRYAVSHDFLSESAGHQARAISRIVNAFFRLGVQLRGDAGRGRRGLPDRLRQRLPGRRGHVAALLLPVGDLGARALVGVLRRHRPHLGRRPRHRAATSRSPTTPTSTTTPRSTPTWRWPTSTSRPSATTRGATKHLAAPRRGGASSGSPRTRSTGCCARRCRRPTRRTSRTSSWRTSGACSTCGSPTRAPPRLRGRTSRPRARTAPTARAAPRGRAPGRSTRRPGETPPLRQPGGSAVRRARQVRGRGHQQGQGAVGRALGDRLGRGVDDAGDPARRAAELTVHDEVRPGEARVRGQGGDRETGRAQATVELVHEEQVGELGRAVLHPALVVLRRRRGVTERRAAGHPVHVGRHHHHPPVAARDELGEQQPGEQERSEVVGRHLGLEAVDGPRQRGRHHAGVVDQHVDRADPGGARPPRRAPIRGRRGPRAAARPAPPAPAAVIAAVVSSSFAGLRPASTTRAPRRASSSAVWWPSPPTDGPVTTTVRPLWSGRSARVQASLTGSRPAGPGPGSRGRGRRSRSPHRGPGPGALRRGGRRSRGPWPATRSAPAVGRARGAPRPSSPTAKALTGWPATSTTRVVPGAAPTRFART